MDVGDDDADGALDGRADAALIDERELDLHVNRLAGRRAAAGAGGGKGLGGPAGVTAVLGRGAVPGCAAPA